MSTDNASATVKSAERALAVLELLAAAESPMAFGEIVTTLGYPRSSLHQLLRTLLTRGWVESDSEPGHYRLGLRTWEAGNAYIRAVDLATRARPYMTEVRDAVAETVQLAVLDGRYNVYVAKVDGRQNLVMASAVGRRIEAHATGLGKVLLAGRSDDDVRALFADVELEAFTAKTVRTLGELLEVLATVRSRGYGTDVEEHTIGVRCVATPLRDHSAGVVAAMSVSVPTARWAADVEHRTLECLLDASERLSTALGYRGDAQLVPSRTA